MSRPTLFGRVFVRRSSFSFLAVGMLLAGTMMIERILESRNAVFNLDSDLPMSSKLHLGLNAIGAENLPIPESSESLLRIPIVDDLPYRQQCIVGLLFLGGVGLVASIRPFDPERPMLEHITHPTRETAD